MGGESDGAMRTPTRAPWEGAFVAVSALLGEPLEAIAGALDDEGRARAGDTLRALASKSREARDGRARAIARAVSEVALAIDALRLA